ncbi:hypothetical protein L1987_74479 [Smallanthus sonchifolius]|uniref:Uncharacterized protein n=1 Tax=Smallanthus sonchifolius TaxID=185202 RepID=A0ACB9A322_9ASTR|nr:hypothetical protein L1987_74479 [Smallanthus sonchifolius]
MHLKYSFPPVLSLSCHAFPLSHRCIIFSATKQFLSQHYHRLICLQHPDLHLQRPRRCLMAAVGGSRKKYSDGPLRITLLISDSRYKSKRKVDEKKVTMLFLRSHIRLTGVISNSTSTIMAFSAASNNPAKLNDKSLRKCLI